MENNDWRPVGKKAQAAKVMIRHRKLVATTSGLLLDTRRHDTQGLRVLD